MGSLGLVAAFGLILAVSYGLRREIARQVLVSWLHERGIDSQVSFDRIDPGQLVATLRAGDADDPDLQIQRVEVDYRLGLPWSGRAAFEATRIRLIGPELQARLVDGRLSFGRLDPILQEFQNRPPSTSATRPTILVQDATLRLTLPSGTLIARGDAELRDNRLVRLDAVLPAAHLRDGDVELDLTRAAVAVRTVRGQTALAVDATLRQVRGVGLSAQGGSLRAVIALPYPDAAEPRLQGPALARLRTDFGEVGWEGGSAQGLSADLAFAGRGEGGLAAFSLSGALQGQVRANRIDAGGARMERATLTVAGDRLQVRRATDVTWSFDGTAQAALDAVGRQGLSGQDVNLRATDLHLTGGEALTTVAGRLTLRAQTLRQADLRLTGVTGDLGLEARLGEGGATSLSGSVRSTGGSWLILGPVGPDDAPEQMALKRAFERFSLDVPSLSLLAGQGAVRVSLGRPVRLSPAQGGEVVIAARDGAPVFLAGPGSPGQGSLSIQAAGGGLPTLRAEVPRYVLTSDGFAAALQGEAELNYGFARGVRLSPVGSLRIGSGQTTFAASRCFPVRVAELDLGENDVRAVSAELCPSDRPMLTIGGGWGFNAQARALAASAPFLDMSASDVAAHLVARDPGGNLSLVAEIRSGTISDTATEPRFLPLRGQGRVSLADEIWTGSLSLSSRTGGHHVMDVGIAHNGRSGLGGVDLDATGLTFAPGGLQPAQISPLADSLVKSPVAGRADFTGRIDWSPQGLTSSGYFATPGLDFASPLGAVHGLEGDTTFTSLIPLETAPGQAFHIAQVDAFVPITDVDLNVGLGAASLSFAGGRIAVAGGHAELEPVEIPLDPEQSWEGVVRLDRVQLGDLFAASSFSDSVQLDAVVSGRLPFIYGPNGVTISGGSVHADQAGRLSIARSVLSGMTADGGGEQVPTNTVEDFAYQALENLSFDHLNAELNSLPGGRLGVLFTIHGRHDPPVEQEIRLGLMELIRRDFLNRTLPLPSGTQINLTLDTSFNLDQLIADLMEIERARNVSERNP